jgi:DNA uptake protein ComE-like DNA-binding protein
MTPRVFLLGLALGCGAANTSGDGESISVSKDLLSTGVLAFLNGPEATFEVLDDDVGLDVRAARGIVRHVRGRDTLLGTRDDNPFDTIEELDAVPYVGQVAFDRIDAWVRARFPENVVVEGVALTAAEAQGIVGVANTATFEELDEDAGLDSRAASGIVDARPFADIDAVGAAPYVGRSAVLSLREYAAAETGPRILRLSAVTGYGYDPYYEESNDGVRVWFQTEGAESCSIDVLAEDGTVIVTRADGVGTSGPIFIGEWNSADPSSPWCTTPPPPAVLCSDRRESGCFICYPGVDVRLTCSNAEGTTSRTVRNELTRKMYVAERYSGQIALVDGTTGERTVIARELGELIGTTIDRRGRLFVHRFGAHAVAMVDPERGTFRDIATGLDGHGLTADPNSDTLYLAGYLDGNVYRLREENGRWRVDTIVSGLALPIGVRLIGPNLYITDREAEGAPGSLWVHNLSDGTTTRLLTIPRGADLLDQEENGDLLIVSYFGDALTRVSLFPARIVRTYEGDFGYGVVVDETDNTAIVSSEESSTIVRIDLDSGSSTPINGEANGPGAMVFR